TTATETYSLTLHDALPIFSGTGAENNRARCGCESRAPIPAGKRRPDYPGTARVSSDTKRSQRHGEHPEECRTFAGNARSARDREDRKSTRLNSSHQIISYA